MAQLLAMVVDDSPIVLKFATTIVEKLGYRVCTASDGLQALALLKDARCKLVLTDYEMPTINGYQLAKKVKSQLPSIRVVIMTGLCQNQVIELMNDQDIDGWLFKPFGLEELKAILWQLGLYDNIGPADSVQLRSPKSNGLNQRKQKMTSITGSD